MQIFRTFFRGVFSVLSVTATPMLYRYPYRNSAEGMKGDWNRIGDDIVAVAGQLHHYAREDRQNQDQGYGQ